MKHRLFWGVLLLATLLLAACGSTTSTSSASSPRSATPVSQNDRVVQVTLTDSQVTSSRTTFMANVPYQFEVTNKGKARHNFIIQTRVQGPALTPQTNQGIRYIMDSTKLKPGATVRFSYEFTQADIKSSVRFIEFLPGPSGEVGPQIPVQVKLS